MGKIAVAALISLLLLMSCGEGEPDQEESLQGVEEVRTVSLVLVDSIGIEMGDSLYVMGAMEGLVYGPDGNIAVLDCSRSCVRIYSPEGLYLRQISKKGNGPGELQDAAFLSISEDGHIFMAGEGSEILGLHQFDYATGEWLGSEASFGSPPTCIEGAEGSSYVRKDLTFDTSTGEPQLLISISKYEYGSDEPTVTYLEDTTPFDPSDMAGLIELLWYGYDIAADFTGNVYIAPRSTEEAVVVIYDTDGNEINRLELDLEPVLRTEEELEIEKYILESKAAIMGDDFPALEPDPYKPLIRGVEIDGEGNIWVLRGGPIVPTFDVFTAAGNQLFTAVVAGNPPDGSSWRFFIDSHGILAYAEDPACGYQKIYMLEIQE